jgi:hypothetical protein
METFNNKTVPVSGFASVHVKEQIATETNGKQRR